MTKILAILAVAAALALAGCIQNMGDLKDRLGATKEEESIASTEVVAPPTTPTAPATNATPPKPPVARISVFGPNGALVYKATFAAEDPAEIVFVEEKSKLTLNAGDSEALERGVELTGFAWTLNGAAVTGGRSATIEVGEAGLYTLLLTVTDAKGSRDTQTVKLGVAPKPFDVVTELTSEPIAGAQGQGEAATLTFDLASAGDTPATVTAVVFEATPGAACDIVLDVLDPNGESLGAKDSASFGEAETITAGALAFGAYTISLAPFVCAAPEGVPVTITVTYLPVVEALGEDHGGH